MENTNTCGNCRYFRVDGTYCTCRIHPEVRILNYSKDGSPLSTAPDNSRNCEDFKYC